jgi:hypothetical protein
MTIVQNNWEEGEEEGQEEPEPSVVLIAWEDLLEWMKIKELEKNKEDDQLSRANDRQLG